MALGETQALLARLFTDAAVRRDFSLDPVEVARRFGLTDDEAAQYGALDKSEVESFAASLLGKRVLDLRKAMPLTAQALGPRFEQFVRESVGALSEKRYRGDAAALVARLRKAADRCEPWIVDIARYEEAFVAASRQCLFVKLFGWDVAALGVALRSGHATPPVRRPALGCWARARGGRLFFRLVALPSLTRGGTLR